MEGSPPRELDELIAAAAGSDLPDEEIAALAVAEIEEQWDPRLQQHVDAWCRHAAILARVEAARRPTPADVLPRLFTAPAGRAAPPPGSFADVAERVQQHQPAGIAPYQPRRGPDPEEPRRRQRAQRRRRGPQPRLAPLPKVI